MKQRGGREPGDDTNVMYHCAIYTDRLSPNHLQQVLDLVWEARTKYYNIGLALELPSDALDTIEKSNSYRVEAIFTEIIKECLRRGLVTQTKLAEAVSSSQVSFAYLSSDILAKKFTDSKAARCKLIFMIIKNLKCDYYSLFPLTAAPPAIVTDGEP